MFTRESLNCTEFEASWTTAYTNVSTICSSDVDYIKDAITLTLQSSWPLRDASVVKRAIRHWNGPVAMAILARKNRREEFEAQQYFHRLVRSFDGIHICVKIFVAEYNKV